jgi:alpha-L-rhamnosidase
VALVTMAGALTVDGLRVEDQARPLGIDARAPRFSWLLQSDQRAQRQDAYQVRVAASAEALAQGKGDVWDSGKVASADTFGIEYGGPALRSDARYFWQVRVWDGAGRASPWSETHSWQMGLLAPADWRGRWIGAAAEAGSPLLRREFSVGRRIVRATAYAYATGWYRLFINGQELTARVLAPVNSNYPKGLFYDTYDVTELMRHGANAVGVWLGQGYNQGYSKYGYRWDGPPAALFQLELVFDDGTTQTVVSDADWRWAPSPVRENDIYHGETYDARGEFDGWSRAGFAAGAWRPVELRAAPAGALRSCPFPGLAIADTLRAVHRAEPKPGVFIFDLGQNIAGWVRLNVNGPAGTRVVLRHAEELNPDGTLDVTTNRAARATDTYILAGRGEETYEPRFTYHGFRYVEVTGYPGVPSLDSLSGQAVHAAVDEAGYFHCSDPVLQRIHQNFRWSIANNLAGIPTDTATRDERTPCQMDSLAVEEAAIANFALGPYYAKWLHDIAGDGGTLPNWTGDQVVLPWLLYQYYGDRRILAEHFANMRQVVDRFAATAAENKYWAGGFGDWAAPNSEGSYEGSFSEGELVARAYAYRCARIVADAAAVLGDGAAAAHYAAHAGELRAEFERRFFQPGTATFGSGRQVTSILPLAFDLVPAGSRAAVVAALRGRITGQDGGRLDTGIFGTRYLFEVLVDHGLADLAFSLLVQPGYPGYADQLAHGATTTWEQWAYRGSMQTHDHAMFAGPDATLFSHFAGIRPGAPGFREIIIRPAVPAGLVFVNAERRTPVGRVGSRWQRVAGQFSLQVSIPPNTTARVHLPARSGDVVRESGRPLREAPGVAAVTAGPDGLVVTVGSGDYEFTVPLPAAARAFGGSPP